MTEGEEEAWSEHQRPSVEGNAKHTSKTDSGSKNKNSSHQAWPKAHHAKRLPANAKSKALRRQFKSLLLHFLI